MPFGNYAQLKTVVTDYLQNDDVSARIDDLIVLAEVRLGRELKVRQMYKSVSGTFAAPDARLVTLPADYVEMVAFRLPSTVPPKVLEYRPPDESMNSVQFGLQGLPMHYTILGNTIYVSPDPGDGAYEYTLEYLAEIPPLAAQQPTQTNWLLQEFPDLYLYASLLEAQPYLLDDARIAVWQGMYERAMDSAHATDMRSKFRPTAPMRPDSGYSIDGFTKIV